MAQPGQPEIQVTVADASEADIAAFQRGDEGRAVDFQAFMNGTPNSEGGTHDMNPRGMTTDQGEFNRPPDLTGLGNPLIPPQPPFLPGQGPQEVSPPPTPAQEEDWRRRYGQSENEKGEYRRLLQEALDREARLVQQFLQTPPPVAPTYPTQDYSQGYNQSFNPQYSQVPSQVGYFQPQLQPAPQYTPKPPGEMVYGEDLEAAIQSRIAPAFSQAYTEVQQTRAQLEQMRQALAERDRAALGITPQLEAQALMEQPWLRNLKTHPDPAAYTNALSNYKQAADARALLARPPQSNLPPLTPTAPAPGTAQSAARRIMYVEPSTNQGTFEPHTQPTDFARDWAVANAEPHIGKKAALFRQVFAKYGMGPHNDWADPAAVTR